MICFSPYLKNVKPSTSAFGVTGGNSGDKQRDDGFEMQQLVGVLLTVVTQAKQ